MKNPEILRIAATLVACGGAPITTIGQASSTATVPAPVSRIAGPQILPVEFGKRPPNTPMTSDNTPFFDAVTYNELNTQKIDKIWKRPNYESCVEDQAHYRIVIAEAINAGQFKDAVVDSCAKASRPVYQGMWYCMNGHLF